MPGLRSLRNRLAVIFALIIAGAIGTIYLSVTPRLEASLTSQRLNSLVADSKRYLPRVASKLPPDTGPPVSPGDSAKTKKRKAAAIKKAKEDRDASIRRTADTSGTEILLYATAEAGPFLVTDSKPTGGVKTEDVRDLAGRAIRTRREVSQTGPTSAGRQAMVAQPTFDADGKITGAAVFATRSRTSRTTSR